MYILIAYHPHRGKPFGAAMETGEVFLQAFGIICQYLTNHILLSLWVYACQGRATEPSPSLPSVQAVLCATDTFRPLASTVILKVYT